MKREAYLERNAKHRMVADSFIQRTEAGQDRIQSFGFVIAAILAVSFSGFFVITDLSGFGRSCEIELDSRINPNDAPVGSLIRLPGIGVGRASAMVAYRENFSEHGGDRMAFETIDDLQKVKGIGPKTSQNISQWLKFE